MQLHRSWGAAALFLLACGPSPLSPITQIGPTEVDRPVEWYLLDDAATLGRDHSGNHHDALPVNVEVIPDATRGHVAHFDASALMIPSVLQSDFTFCFWLKTNQEGPNQTTWRDGPRIINADIPGVRLDFNLSLALKNLAMGTGSPNEATMDNTALKSQRPVVDGTWHHIAIQRDGQLGVWQIFVDGTLDAQRPEGAIGPLTLPAAMSLGDLGDTSPAVPTLTADLSDARIYDRVLEATAISFLANPNQ